MNLARPFSALSDNVDVDVLVVLAGSTTPRTGRELARMTRRSNTGVQHVLDRLVAHGLVERTEAGRAFLYVLDRDHLLAPIVEQMVEVRAELIRRLREVIGAWTVPAVHASLFGSAARGDGGLESDIDLFIVRSAGIDAEDETWRRQIDALTEKVGRWTGNHAGVAEISDAELPQLRRDRPAVVEEVRADGIDLAGQPSREILGRFPSV